MNKKLLLVIVIALVFLTLVASYQLISEFGSSLFEDVTSLENINRDMIGFLFFAFIAIAIVALGLFSFNLYYTHYYAPRVGRAPVPTTKQQEAMRELESLKKKRKSLRAKLNKLKLKEPYGLTAEEAKQKKFYEQELAGVEEELLNNKLFMDQLITRAESAFGQAMAGTPSREIKKQLREEDYTEKEVRIIEKLFKKKKRMSEE